MTGIGMKRDPNERRKGLKRGKSLNRVSRRRRRNHPIWELVREWCRADLGKRHGRPAAVPEGEEESIEVQCACCGAWVPLDQLHADHILGRVATGPGDINPYWDPTTIQFVCGTCHESKTNPKNGPANHIDYAAVMHGDYRADTVILKSKILRILGGLYGSMKYPDSAQIDAIQEALGVDQTCGECGAKDCECPADSEGPEE